MDYILQSLIYKHMTFIKGNMQSIKQSLQTICNFDLPFVSRYKQEFSKFNIFNKMAVFSLVNICEE